MDIVNVLRSSKTGMINQSKILSGCLKEIFRLSEFWCNDIHKILNRQKKTKIFTEQNEKQIMQTTLK